MILSHAHKYVFVKNYKVAGTSMELFLSRFIGADDIVTPIGEEPEFIPSGLRHFFGRDQRFQNHDGYFNHVSGDVVRERIGHELWGQFFTFCFEREPVSKLISQYHFHTSDIGDRGDPVAEFLDFAYPDFGSVAFHYIRGGRIMVDKVADFGHMQTEFSEICERLDLPFDGDLGFASKGQYKTQKRPDLPLDDGILQDLTDAYALEAEHLPFMAIPGRGPSSPAALRWCEARAARRNGRMDEAERSIAQARRSDADFLPALREEALIDWRLGRRDEALSKCLQVLDRAPHRIRHLLDLAMFQSGVGDHESAERSLRDAIERSPRNPRLPAKLALLLAATGQRDVAVTEMNRSIAMLREGKPNWILGHIQSLCWQERFEDALDFIRGNLVLGDSLEEFTIPDGQISHLKELDFLRLVGTELAGAGKLGEARNVMLDPRLVEQDGGAGLVPIIKATVETGDSQACETLVSDMLDLAPSNPHFFNSTIRIVRRSKDPALIKKLTTRIYQACPGHQALHDKCLRMEALLEQA